MNIKNICGARIEAHLGIFTPESSAAAIDLHRRFQAGANSVNKKKPMNMILFTQFLQFKFFLYESIINTKKLF